MLSNIKWRSGVYDKSQCEYCLIPQIWQSCDAGCRDSLADSAYQSDAYTMAAITERFDVHYMTVSRAVRAVEGKRRGALECELTVRSNN